MKITRFLSFALSLAVSTVLADADNQLITFSTVGPDCYADGTTVVKDGEWYALCWSAKESFGGLSATDLSSLVEGDELLLMAPLAKGGRCPYTVFQVDSSKRKSNGYYFVMVLDTRNPSGVPSAVGADRRPKFVNGFSKSVNIGSRNEMSFSATDSKSTGDWAATDASAAGGELRVASIVTLPNDKVMLTVSGMLPNLRYEVVSGSTPSELESEPVCVTDPRAGANDGVDVQFVFDKNDARFFKVIRQPLK